MLVLRTRASRNNNLEVTVLITDDARFVIVTASVDDVVIGKVLNIKLLCVFKDFGKMNLWHNFGMD